MEYKYEIILDEKQSADFEEYFRTSPNISFKKTPYPQNTGRPAVQYDEEQFIELYLLYVFKEISKAELLGLLKMSNTTFHKTLKYLKEEKGLPMYSRANADKYMSLIEDYRFLQELNLD